MHSSRMRTTRFTVSPAHTPGPCIPPFHVHPPATHAPSCHACPPPAMHAPSVDRMTDTSENVSLPQTSFAGGSKSRETKSAFGCRIWELFKYSTQQSLEQCSDFINNSQFLHSFPYFSRWRIWSITLIGWSITPTATMANIRRLANWVVKVIETYCCWLAGIGGVVLQQQSILL